MKHTISKRGHILQRKHIAQSYVKMGLKMVARIVHCKSDMHAIGPRLPVRASQV